MQPQSDQDSLIGMQRPSNEHKGPAGWAATGSMCFGNLRSDLSHCMCVVLPAAFPALIKTPI